MKLTPNSMARRRTAIALAGSLGGPQIPSPVRRMAPKPRRLTVSSPPSERVPLLAADRLVFAFSFIFILQNTLVYWMTAHCDLTPVSGRDSAACQPELRTLILGATVVVLGPRSFS